MYLWKNQQKTMPKFKVNAVRNKMSYLSLTSDMLHVTTSNTFSYQQILTQHSHTNSAKYLIETIIEARKSNAIWKIKPRFQSILVNSLGEKIKPGIKYQMG